MTYKQILEALKHCAKNRSKDGCYRCAYAECDSDIGCVGEFMEDTLELIERLKGSNNSWRRELKDCESGSIVKIGNMEFIVLDQFYGEAFLITLDSVKRRNFDTESADYETSNIRKWLNSTFYKKLSEAVGAENIAKHTVDLMADDGTGKGISVDDYVSLITAENYRKYREIITPINERWWTATKATYETPYADIFNCCIDGWEGALKWEDTDVTDAYAVRPVCVLNSDVLVEEGEG